MSNEPKKPGFLARLFGRGEKPAQQPDTPAVVDDAAAPVAMPEPAASAPPTLLPEAPSFQPVEAEAVAVAVIGGSPVADHAAPSERAPTEPAAVEIAPLPIEPPAVPIPASPVSEVPPLPPVEGVAAAVPRDRKSVV